MVTTFLAALFPTIWAALLLAVLAAATAPLLVRFAANRTLTRHLAFALEDETSTLAGLLADPRRYPYLATLSSTDFAAGTHGRIHAAYAQAAAGHITLTEDLSEADCDRLGAALAGQTSTVHAQIAAILAAGPSPAGDTARVGELLQIAATRGYGPTTDEAQRQRADEKIVAAAQNVLAAGQDRNRLSGAGLVLPTATPDSTDPNHPPLARVKTAATWRRQVATAALTGGSAALLPGIVAAAGFTGAAAILAGAALAALLVMSVLVSLVDIDTLYIDTPTWAIGTTASWVLALAATLAAGVPGRLVAGVVCVVGVVILFEGTNLLFRLVRGTDGQGFGDTLIIVATVGAPAALTGALTVGYYSVLFGALAGAAGWLTGKIAGRVDRNTPFAFGPWLAAGWVLALCWHVAATGWIL